MALALLCEFHDRAFPLVRPGHVSLRHRNVGLTTHPPRVKRLCCRVMGKFTAWLKLSGTVRFRTIGRSRGACQSATIAMPCVNESGRIIGNSREPAEPERLTGNGSRERGRS